MDAEERTRLRQLVADPMVCTCDGAMEVVEVHDAKLLLDALDAAEARLSDVRDSLHAPK